MLLFERNYPFFDFTILFPKTSMLLDAYRLEHEQIHEFFYSNLGEFNEFHFDRKELAVKNVRNTNLNAISIGKESYFSKHGLCLWLNCNEGIRLTPLEELPIFLRTIEGVKISDKQINALNNMLKSFYNKWKDKLGYKLYQLEL